MGSQVSACLGDVPTCQGWMEVFNPFGSKGPFPLRDLPQDVCSVILQFLTGQELYTVSQHDHLGPLRSALTYQLIFQDVEARRKEAANSPNLLDPFYSSEDLVWTEKKARERRDILAYQPWGYTLHSKYAHTWGISMHVPSKERLLRILYSAHCWHTCHEDTMMICDTCRQRKPEVRYVDWWGLFLCESCSNMSDHLYYYELERCRCDHAYRGSRQEMAGPRAHFVRWSISERSTRFQSFLSSKRVAVFCGVIALEKPVFDPYTNEPCGPIVSQNDIDAMILSGQSIESFLSPQEGLLRSKLKPLLDAAEATHNQRMEELDRQVLLKY